MHVIAVAWYVIAKKNDQAYFMTSMAQVTAKFKSTGNKQSCSELKIGNFSVF